MKLESFFGDNRGEMVGALTKFSGDQAAAEDAVHDCFIKAMSYRYQLEQMPEPAMKAWLYATARNSLIDTKRKTSRLNEFTEDTSADSSYYLVSNDHESRMLADSALKLLPYDLKKVVTLKYYTGLNATEIGGLLRIPPATVRTRLRKAMSLMREALED